MNSKKVNMECSLGKVSKSYDIGLEEEDKYLDHDSVGFQAKS